MENYAKKKYSKQFIIYFKIYTYVLFSKYFGICKINISHDYIFRRNIK